MWVCLRHGSLHFRHRNHRQEADEDQKERSENSERANVCPDVHPSRNKQTPRRGEKVAVQSANNDDESLEPHAGVHAHADKINDIDIPAAPPEPKELRREHVAKEHAHPPIPPIGAEDAVPKRKLFVGIAAVPRDEKLHHVGVGHE